MRDDRRSGRWGRRATAAAAAMLAGGSGFVPAAVAESGGEAVAADGSLIAWVADDDLWVANPDGTGLDNLTDGLAVAVWNEGDVDFTPDRKRIVFGTDTGQYVVRIATGAVTALPGTDALTSFGLSPDGDELGLYDGTTMYTAPIDGSAAPASIDTDGIDVDNPSWAPNGEQIAFNTPCCASMEVYVVDEAGGTPVLISTSSEVQPSAPVWSPDGDLLAYEAIFPAGPDSVNNIVVAAADGSGGQVGVAPKATSTDNRQPVWSPDGSMIAFQGTTDLGSSNDVLVAPSNGAAAPVVVSEGAEQSYGVASDEPWSPDSTRLVLSDSATNTASVVQADAAGSPVPLAFPTGDGIQVRWSNDGTQMVALVRFDPPPAAAGAGVGDPKELTIESTVFVAPSDGSEPTTGISAGSGSAFAGAWWSPPEVSFTDVAEAHPFYGDIVWMVVNGITNGYADDSFRPTASVTRAAMAAFLYRLAGEPAFTPPVAATFTDVSTAHPFFLEIEWMVDAGIAGGFADGTFRPGARISRQAMAVFLYGLAGEPSFIHPPTPTFPDVPSSHPFSHEIEWMVAAGITGGYADGTFHPAASISRQAMAAFLHRFDDLGL